MFNVTVTFSLVDLFSNTTVYSCVFNVFSFLILTPSELYVNVLPLYDLILPLSYSISYGLVNVLYQIDFGYNSYKKDT